MFLKLALRELKAIAANSGMKRQSFPAVLSHPSPGVTAVAYRHQGLHLNYLCPGHCYLEFK